MSFSQANLFASSQESIKLDLADADVILFPAFIDKRQADELFSRLSASLAWRQDSIRIYGRQVKIPRLQAWYGDPEASYTYSNLTMTPLAWTRELLQLKSACEAISGARYNSVLANLYRDGQDSMGWHSDDEPELGERPTIASLSLGETRDFDFRHKHSGAKHRLALPHGSLLVMAGSTQQYWQHGITKRAKPLGARINLTFRHILQGHDSAEN